MRGQAYPAINDSDFAILPVPLPPLAEQQRIVARVEELMALFDEMEAARAGQESLRDALGNASLRQLTSTEGARSCLEQFDRFLSRPEHVSKLRNSILDLAVKGRLVPQDQHDEPASTLLERIGASRSSSSQGVSEQEQISGWQVTTVGLVSSVVTSGSRGWAEYYSSNGAGFIRAQNIRFGRLILDDLAHVKLPLSVEGIRTRIDRNDILIVIPGAGVTNPAMVDVDLDEAYVSQHIGLVKLRSSEIARWILLCLMAPAGARNQLVARAYGAGKPGLNLDNVRTLSVPIPPLPEQRRIIAKVDQLMDLCDEFEIILSIVEITRGRLLDALVRDALNHETAQA
jgi:type I restriction enzyme, S subunit